MTNSYLAELKGVHKRYGPTLALDGLYLHVERRELLAVLGPNGPGKTTAISLLLGLERADQEPPISLLNLPRSMPRAAASQSCCRTSTLPPSFASASTSISSRAATPIP